MYIYVIIVYIYISNNTIYIYIYIYNNYRIYGSGIIVEYNTNNVR